MIRGFFGMAASSFIRDTNDAMAESSREHSRDPFESYVREEGDEGPARRPRRTIRAVNQRPLFSPEAALRGTHAVGVRNSSNVVVDQDTYEEVLRRLNAVDDQAGEDIYKCCAAIEEMCQSTLIIPETLPRILEITSQLKNSLGEFRALTEETSIRTKNFVNRVVEIDREY